MRCNIYWTHSNKDTLDLSIAIRMIRIVTNLKLIKQVLLIISSRCTLLAFNTSYKNTQVYELISGLIYRDQLIVLLPYLYHDWYRRYLQEDIYIYICLIAVECCSHLADQKCILEYCELLFSAAVSQLIKSVL